MLYSGFKHGFIPQFVQTHKKKYPFYIKVDIAKFYPSIKHHHLKVETQLAYKKLLGLRYVPKKFKAYLLPLLDQWFDELPTQYQGVPLNSAMSKALTPLLLVPFF